MFAKIVKKKKKDDWFVVQGRIIQGNNGYTVGDIVYSGKGGPIVIEKAIKCNMDIKTLPFVNTGVDPIGPALGYKSGSSLTRYTLAARLKEESHGFRISITVGPENDSLLITKFFFFDLKTSIPFDYMLKDNWSKLNKMFLYAESYDTLNKNN